MTDNEINAAIAEACGWTNINSAGKAGRAPNADYIGYEFIPDYCNDLNAMHNAEGLLSESQWQDFVDHLVNDWSSLPDPWKEVCHATAKEKAKAYLKTLGKWKEAQA